MLPAGVGCVLIAKPYPDLTEPVLLKEGTAHSLKPEGIFAKTRKKAVVGYFVIRTAYSRKLRILQDLFGDLRLLLPFHVPPQLVTEGTGKGSVIIRGLFVYVHIPFHAAVFGTLVRKTFKAR